MNKKNKDEDIISQFTKYYRTIELKQRDSQNYQKNRIAISEINPGP
jgi:Holliday junction resolvase-like predicted endonuclease